MNTATRGSQSASTVGGNSDAFNFREREDPVKFEFGEGALLVGTLTNLERTTVRDSKNPNTIKNAVKYTVEELESGKPVFFFGTHQLDSKLRVQDVGHVVKILCKGEDKSVTRNGNAMKIFTVMVSEQFAPGWANDGTPITDDDLPPAHAY